MACADAPEKYIEAELKAIIGLEIKLSSIERKWKVGQNRNEKDRKGATEKLSKQGQDEMSALIRQYGSRS